MVIRQLKINGYTLIQLNEAQEAFWFLSYIQHEGKISTATKL
jgi:hypothetical protein